MIAMVGNDVIFATSATLGGHCEIGDFVFIGGLSAVHQFARIGSQVMVGGVCGVRGDVIPFGLVNGQYASLEGLNIIGMKRRKFTRERLATVRSFYQKLFHGPGVFRRTAEPGAAAGGRGSRDRRNSGLHRRRQASRAVPSGRRGQQALMTGLNASHRTSAMQLCARFHRRNGWVVGEMAAYCRFRRPSADRRGGACRSRSQFIARGIAVCSR